MADSPANQSPKKHGDETGTVGATGIRDDLDRLVGAELLGPADGEVEEIDEGRVVDRYLVGMLAPKQQYSGQERDEAFEEGTSSAASDDGRADPVTTRSDSLLPSSFGLTFVVDEGVDEIEIDARWGRYERVESRKLMKDDGSPKRVWKRMPCGGTLRLRLADRKLGPLKPDEKQQEVVVRGVMRQGSGERTITLFLVNEQEVEKETKLKDQYWLFQAELRVRDSEGKSIFRRRPHRLAVGGPGDELHLEERELEMLYRRDQEFAVGHGIAVDWDVDEADPWRCKRLWTVAIPSYDVRQQDSPTPEDEGYDTLANVELRMDRLAEGEPGCVCEMLQPLIDAYASWIENERRKIGKPEEGLSGYEDVADRVLQRCETTRQRMQAGLDLLGRDPLAMEAFQFANRAMRQQRIRSIYSLKQRRDPKGEHSPEDVDAEPENKSWRPFQIAFILLNLESTTDLHHPDRSHPTDAVADLLWFPTGGGKTEAYLGLAAYAMGLRRLQGIVGGRPGAAGLCVLMRYTLRLLTLQQFQRATALICAMEMIRRDTLATGGDRADRWGTEDQPFSIGLWVGRKATPNWTKDSSSVVSALRAGNQYAAAGRGFACPVDQLPMVRMAHRPRKKYRGRDRSERARPNVHLLRQSALRVLQAQRSGGYPSLRGGRGDLPQVANTPDRNRGQVRSDAVERPNRDVVRRIGSILSATRFSVARDGGCRQAPKERVLPGRRIDPASTATPARSYHPRRASSHQRTAGQHGRSL